MAFVPSTFERSWPTVILTPITIANSVVTVSSTAGLHEKQTVTLRLGAASDDFQIRRVLSDTQVQLCPVGKEMAPLLNPTQYSGGTLTMSEQNRNPMGADIVMRAVYEEGPAVALRTMQVNKFGMPIDTIIDKEGVHRLAVDGQFTAAVDVQVQVDIDGEYDPVNNPDPDDIGLVLSVRNTVPGKPNQTQRPTAIRGSSDTNVVSMDMSLHDQNGNAYTPANPVPVVNGGYDKLFTLVAASKFLALSNYDKLVPTYTGTSHLVIGYYENNALVGEATVNNVSETDWDITFAAYINDTDGSKLQDDDGTDLNLD